MKYLIVLLASCIVANALPSWPYPIHPGVGAIYKGPNSETIIEGPDGSVITSEAEGGHIAIGDSSVVAPHPARLVPAPVGPVLLPNVVPIVAPTILAKPAPIFLQNNPIIVDDIPIIEQKLVVKDPKIIEEHILVGNKIITVPKKVEENSDLIGPSGTISTRGGDVVISGPASTTIKGGGVVSSIQKQPDLHIKSIEVKPIVPPVVITSQPIPIVAQINPAPVLETQTILRSGPIISESRPLIRPVYAEAAPVYSVNPLVIPNTPIVRVNNNVGFNEAIDGGFGLPGPVLGAHGLVQGRPILDAQNLPGSRTVASPQGLLAADYPALGPQTFVDQSNLQATINQADLDFINSGHLLKSNLGPQYASSYPPLNLNEGIYQGGPRYNTKPIYRGPLY